MDRGGAYGLSGGDSPGSLDRTIGLELYEVSVDGCITKAPCEGKSPPDRGKRGIKRSTMVDARGIPLAVLTAPANRHASPLLAPTLDAQRKVLELPEHASVHLDRVYTTRRSPEGFSERGVW